MYKEVLVSKINLYVIFRVLEDWPNTYCFTKAIAENLVLINGIHLPMSVFRPSISKFIILIFFMLLVKNYIIKITNILNFRICEILFFRSCKTWRGGDEEEVFFN